MRIGFFSDMYLPRADGIAYSIETFRTELEALGHEVFVIAPRPSLRHKETSDRIIRFPAVKGLFFDDYLTSFFFPPQAIKQIDKLKLDIIHYHTPGQIGLFGAYYALRHKMPLVSTYHTDLYEYVRHYPAVLPGTIALAMLAPVITGGGMDEYRSGLSSIKPERSIDKWNQKIVERSVTIMHNHCDVVITPSRKTARQLKGWKTKSPVQILPTGVDKITTTEAEIASIRKKHGISEDDQVVLFVGRVGTEKNLGILIDAFSEVAAKRPEAKLVIAGTGDDLENFKKQATAGTANNRIIFAGYVDHALLGAYYGMSTLFAFPSVADTQGLVLNEAARAGLPLVIVDREVSEVFKPNLNGLAARNTAGDLAIKIVQILKSKARQKTMSTASLELSSKYGAGQQAAKLLRLYEKTIEQHHARAATAKSTKS